MKCPTCKDLIAKKIYEGNDYDTRSKPIVLTVYRCDNGHTFGTHEYPKVNATLQKY